MSYNHRNTRGTRHVHIYMYISMRKQPWGHAKQRSAAYVSALPRPGWPSRLVPWLGQVVGVWNLISQPSNPTVVPQYRPLKPPRRPGGHSGHAVRDGVTSAKTFVQHNSPTPWRYVSRLHRRTHWGPLSAFVKSAHVTPRRWRVVLHKSRAVVRGLSLIHI